MTHDAAVRERVAEKNPDYRRLARKHREYEKRLAEMQHQKYLSEEDRVEEVRLKKLKLAIKDEMESILRREAN